MGTWREGGRNSAPQLHSLLLQHRFRLAAPHLQRPGSASGLPRPAGLRSAERRDTSKHPPLPPRCRQSAPEPKPRAGGRGPPGPWARSPPGRLRGASAAGAAGLPPVRVTCAERGSPASPPRPRRSGDAGAPEADTAARSPARPRRPPASSAAGPHQLPPPHGDGGRRGAARRPRPRSLCGISRCLGGSSGERLPAGPRLRLGAVTKHWNRLPREIVESPSLEILKNSLDAILCSVFRADPPWAGSLDQMNFYLHQGSLGSPDSSKNTCNNSASVKPYEGTKVCFR
ncbi:collagen alpha-1(I) chain-like [Parus major]|uniref:collagen alpha-1(I) chain-like n=1 Tax=Parus major TaxID=9157 RepID=UPI001443D1AE|nr:collagen alpha-1(I) chain-like [Parus major]